MSFKILYQDKKRHKIIINQKWKNFTNKQLKIDIKNVNFNLKFQIKV